MAASMSGPGIRYPPLPPPPPPPYIPGPPPPYYSPPAPSRPRISETLSNNATKIGIGVAIVAGVGIFAWGLYTFLNNVSGGGGGPGAGQSQCQAQWQTAYAGYMSQYQAFVKANGGGPPTAQQEQALQPFKDQMTQATSCIQNLATTQATVWTDTVTKAVVAIVTGAAAVASLSAYLSYRGGIIKSNAEAINAGRNAAAHQALADGTMSQSDAVANVTQTASETAAVAQEEAAAGSSTYTGVAAEAQAAGDQALLASAEEYQAIYDGEVTEVAAESTWFYDFLP